MQTVRPSTDPLLCRVCLCVIDICFCDWHNARLRLLLVGHWAVTSVHLGTILRHGACFLLRPLSSYTPSIMSCSVRSLIHVGHLYRLPGCLPLTSMQFQSPGHAIRGPVPECSGQVLGGDMHNLRQPFGQTSRPIRPSARFSREIFS